MGSLLEWGKPPRKEDPEVRAQYWGGEVPGAYAPNMDADWMERWKARLAGQRGEELRVEIRKTTRVTRGSSVQMLIIVHEDGSIRMSMNGTAELSAPEWIHMQAAVHEAMEAMTAWRLEHPLEKQAAAQ